MKTSKVKCAVCNKEFEVYGKFKRKISRKARKQGFTGTNLLDMFVPAVPPGALGCENTKNCENNKKGE